MVMPIQALAYPSPVLITDTSKSNLNPDNNMVVNFTFDDPECRKFKGYDIVKIKGCSLTTNIGEPKLPVKTKIIFIPKSSVIIDIEVSSETEEMDGNFSIYPTQPPIPVMNATNATNASFIVNYTVYNSSSPYPGRIVEYSVGYMVNREIVIISVYPLQYIPIEGKIVFHRNITVTVKITLSEPESEGKEIFVKFTQKDNFSSSSRPKYIIITNEELEESFNVLADWKTKKGVHTAVFNTSWINNTYSGADTQVKIRNFIRDAYQKWDTEYVLLGGDTDIVPCRGAYGNVSGVAALGGDYKEDTNIPADLYYSCLNGMWDANGNSIYGEVDDAVDLFPNVIVGRAPVDTVEEARTFVNKTLMYEKNPPMDYQLNILFLAEKLCDDPTPNGTYGGDAKDMIDTNLSYIPPQFTITKKYERDGNASASIAIIEMNEGPHIINHVGHGYYTGFSVKGWIGSSDASGLTNNPRNFILYTISCMSNGFDHDSVSEHYMNNPDGGTVAYIGNSRYGWFEPGFPGEGPSDLYDQQFFNCLFNYSIYNIGATLACSKIFYIPYSQEDGNGMRWLQYAINLLGDPDLPVWTEEPKELNVSYECNATRINISIRSKPEEAPVKDALVCLQSENTYLYNYTDLNGTIIFENALKEDLNLTVTKHNFLPYEGVIKGIVHDVYIESNYTGAYDTGIRIDNATGGIVPLDQNLTIGESYYIKYKVVNNGTGEVEDVNITVKVSNATSWSVELANYSQSININDSHEGNVTWNITTTELAEGIYNITVNASIASEDVRPEDNERTREVMLEKMPPGKPSITITQWYPLEAIVNNIAGESRTFKVAANQTVNVTWYINGSAVQTNKSVPAEVNATYTNLSAVVGAWNVSAIASNENGTDMHTWNWTVEAEKHDVNVSTDYEGAIDGIKITKNGEEVVEADENLTIGQIYKIHYKIVNDGNVKEDAVNVTVTFRNSSGWNETSWHNFSLGVNENRTYNVSWDTTGLAEGNYTIYVNASIPLDEDESNNKRSREIFAALENSPSPCFIATAAYGTPLHEDIDVLRDFRDEYLMSNAIGKEFVKAYYAASPPIAEVISEHEGLRMIVREGMVKPLVYIVRGL
ncbi:MAG: C25 family cysteine peptidase [archaeon]|nr:C25 family cysteine peptidase [archaeon]